jgi:hypothetical protein
MFYSKIFSLSLKLGFSCFKGMLSRFRNEVGSLTMVAFVFNYIKR